MTGPDPTAPYEQQHTGELTNAERGRYARHLRLPGFGVAAQRRLIDSSALVVGAGGLGSPALQYLAAAGVGRIGIVDFDTVDLSNLQRQVLFSESDIGRNKAAVAAERLAGMNGAIEVEAWGTELGADNAEDLISRYDVVLDGCDNFATRYLVNDAAVRTGTPIVYGSVYRYEGQIAVLNHNGGPTYRCLFPDPPHPGETPSCADAGVLAHAAGMIGVHMSWEAIRLLAGLGGPEQSGRPPAAVEEEDAEEDAEEEAWTTLAVHDLMHGTHMELRVHRVEEQVARALRGPLGESERYNAIAGGAGSEEGVRYGRGSGAARPGSIDADLPVADVRRRISAGEATLIDIREAGERELGPDLGGLRIPGSMVRDRPDLMPEEGAVVFYCDSGARSRSLAQWYRSRGWARVHSLAGGSIAWMSQDRRQG